MGSLLSSSVKTLTKLINDNPLKFSGLQLICFVSVYSIIPGPDPYDCAHQPIKDLSSYSYPDEGKASKRA